MGTVATVPNFYSIKTNTMKSLLFIFLFSSLQSLAQQTKPRLFVGIYETAKRGICSDYAYVKEEIADYAEFAIKRKEFYETYKTNSKTLFVDNNEAVIIYEYDKKISGWNCNSKVVSYKTGKTIEDCQKLLADQLAKNPSDFTTTPKMVFSWLGKPSSSEYIADYGGLTGKFIAADLAPKSIILAQLKNTTKDQLAYVQLTTDDGKIHFEFLDPGITLTKKYDTETLEISVVYQKNNKPKQPFSIIDFVKGHVKDYVTKKKGVVGGTVIGIRG